MRQAPHPRLLFPLGLRVGLWVGLGCGPDESNATGQSCLESCRLFGPLASPVDLGGQREEAGEPACHSLKWSQPLQKEDLASVSPENVK